MLLKRAIFVVMILVASGGCATRIIPPAKPANPVSVYVTDYGRHSSILLPMGDGHLMEYSYGDWEFYALNKYKWYIGATKLIYSDASGLGRRIVPHPGDDQALHKLIASKRLMRIDIENSRVMELLAELDLRYNERIDTLIRNDYHKAYFVKDHSRYGLFNTCNVQTAGWLRKLGCEVDGLAVLSNFEVVRPKESVAIHQVKGEPVQLTHQQSKNGKTP